MNERIKQVRKYFKKTQAEFGSELNVSKPSIQAYEYGNTNITDRTIADICRVYGVNETWLRTGEGQMFETPTREQNIAQLTAAFYKADDPEWADFLIEINKLLIQMTPEQIIIFKNAALKLFGNKEE